MTHRVWPFMPQQGVTETLEWKTDVFRTKEAEQRVALREAPRQVFGYKYFMNEHQSAMARAIAYGWGHGQFGVPVWPDVAFLGAVPSSATTITVDTAIADYRVGGLVLVWESEDMFAEATVYSMTGGSITLTSPVGTTFTAAYICPLRLGKSVDGLTIKRGPNLLAKSDIEFRIEDNADLGASAGFPTLDGVDVLTDVVYYLGDHDERIIREIEVMDNGTGVVYTPARFNRSGQTFTIGFSTTNRADLMRIRKWLHLRKGKLKPFWLISQAHDLTLLTNMLSTDSSIEVKSIKYGLYYTSSALAILRKNGAQTYHLVTSGSTVGSTDILNFSTAAGVTANVPDVERISFMRKVRLDVDRIEISHEENNYATIKVLVSEVPN